MQFVNPAALWLLVLCILPLLLSRRTSRVRYVVSNAYLWRDAVQRAGGQLAPRRRQPTPLVLVQMACIAAIVFSLAGPVVSWAGGRTAIAFDLSASMAAREGDGTRIGAARARVRTVLAGLPRFSRVRLILATAAPRQAGEWAVSDPRLLAAIDALQPAAGAADLPGAIELATAAGDVNRVVVLSDNDVANVGGTGATTLESWRIGEPAANVAATRIAARRTELGGRGGDVVVGLRNYGTDARDADLEIEVDGRTAHRARIGLRPARLETVNVRLDDLGRFVTARLAGGDALSIDDTRSIAVPARTAVRVALLGPRGSFLERALAVNPSVALRTFDPSVQLKDLDAAQDFDVAVCDGCADSRADGIPSLVVAAATGERTHDVVRVVAAGHALAESLQPNGARATVSAAADADSRVETVLRVGAAPAVTALDSDGHRRVDIHLDLGESEFVLSPAFPVLVANAIAWLAAGGAVPDEILAGEPLAFTVHETAAVRVSGPDGGERELRRVGPRVIVGETEAAGQYRVRVNGVEHLVAVNPDTDAESDLSGARTIRAGTADGVPRSPAPHAISRWLLLLALVFLAVEWRLRGSGDRRHLAWRAATALLVVLAASGLRVPAGEAPMTIVAALDRSASVPPGARQRAFDRLDALRSTMRAQDRLGLVSFGADAAIEWRPADGAQPQMRASVSEAGTDIGAGLRLARALLPQDGNPRILLLSDGQDDSTHTEHETLRAAAAGVPVDVIQPAIDGLPLLVTRVGAPDQVAIREPYTLSVEVSGTPGARGRVAVFCDDRSIGTYDTTIGADGSAGFALDLRQDAAGSYVYRASLETDDAESAAHSAGAVVVVAGQPVVLYVTDSSAPLRAPLAGAGFQVRVVAPADVPASAAALSAFAGVVLDDVAADSLTTAAIEALADFVENRGGGLLLLGSARTLTLAGYPATPLGRLLPIDLRPRSGQRSTPAELVFVFDKSGSMSDMVGGVSKIEVARQAVAEAVQLMPAGDAIGVLAFDAKAEAVSPLAAARDGAALRAALARVRPGGSTAIAPAIETAQQWLRAPGRTSGARRHIVLMSDGRTSDEDAARVLELARAGGVELSVVAIGSNANRMLLEELARSTGGRAYFPADLRELPRMVAREAARSSAGAVLQERFVPRPAAHPVLAGVSPAPLPALNGYVVSAARPSATAILASHLDDPVLCAWRAGLGRVAVYMADLSGPWSAGLRSSPASSQLWVQAVRWLSRRDADSALRAQIRDGSPPRIEVETGSPDGSLARFDTITAVVRPPSGAAGELTLEPVAPGRYAAPVPVTSTGPYTVAITAQDDRTAAEHRIVRAMYWSADREMRARGTNAPFLSRLASMTGGRVLGDAGNPFNAPRARAYADISRWLAALALALFVGDLFGGRRPPGANRSRGEGENIFL